MTKGKDAVELYLQQIKDCIYSLASSDEFIMELRDDCYSYSEEYPDCTLENFIDLYGDPEIVAKDYLENINVITPQKIANAKRRKKVIIAVLVLAVSAALITTGVYLYDLHQINQGYNTQTIIIED